MSNQPPRLSYPCLDVVMPCYNEVGTIETAIKRVLELPFLTELIVIDDGSTDGTTAVLASMSEPRLRVVRQDRNRGKGAALRKGFSIVTAPYVAIQDADLEYDPAEYKKLIQPLSSGRSGRRGLRLAASSRLTAQRVLYFWHYAGNLACLSLLSNMFTNLNLTDMETCYKVFRRDVLDQIVIEEGAVAVRARGWPRSPGSDVVCTRSGSATTAERTTRARRSAGVTAPRAVVAIAKYSYQRSHAGRRRSDSAARHRFD